MKELSKEEKKERVKDTESSTVIARGKEARER